MVYIITFVIIVTYYMWLMIIILFVKMHGGIYRSVTNNAQLSLCWPELSILYTSSSIYIADANS